MFQKKVNHTTSIELCGVNHKIPCIYTRKLVSIVALPDLSKLNVSITTFLNDRDHDLSLGLLRKTKYFTQPIIHVYCNFIKSNTTLLLFFFVVTSCS